jgi:putative component of membrane protein insertase Oxa1/YidC/SpoIIIJ protein YidD
LQALAVICILIVFSGCSLITPQAQPSQKTDSPLKSLIHFYRGPLNHLSAIRTGTCPMYPGCSSYALEAIEKHGTLIGWVMTCDRLMRCGRDEIHLSPEIIVDDNWKIHDTVEKNDFWWYCNKKYDKIIYKEFNQIQNWKISIE